MSAIQLTEVDDATIPAPAAGKIRVFADDVLHEPAYKGSDDVTHPLVGAAGTPGADGADGADAPPLTSFDAGASGAALELDLADGDVQTVDLTANAAMTFTGWPAAPDVGIVVVWFIQPGAGGPFAPTFAAAVDWGQAGEPVWSTDPDAVDIIKFQSIDAGTRIVATVDGRQGPAGVDGADGADGLGVPAGGTTGQVLAKASNADNDTEWADPTTPTPLAWDVDTVDTDESTSSGSFGDLATAGPAVTLTVNTKVRVTVSCGAYSGATMAAAMCVAVSGANTIAAAFGKGVELWVTGSDNTIAGTRVTVLEGLTPGSTTFTAKYARYPSGTANFRFRQILVECLD